MSRHARPVSSSRHSRSARSSTRAASSTAASRHRRMARPCGVVCHGNGWVEYARPLVPLIMACIIIGVADIINIGITNR